MNQQQLFSDLKIVELASVLAGPSVGLFFAELGATVIKIENTKTNGDVTRSWKLLSESVDDKESAYYWSVNTGKQIVFLNLQLQNDLQQFYTIIKDADVLITNYKSGNDIKLKVDFNTLKKINQKLIYASITGFGLQSPRTAYDLILQAESGFMFMNGEKNSKPLKMPVALIDLLAGHQLKEAILIALLQRYKTNLGCQVSVSLFDAAVASLANQATNWLIANELPAAQGSLHPNIAPYGEIFTTKDKQQITFAIGSDKQFKAMCVVLNCCNLVNDSNYTTNQLRVKHRAKLFDILNLQILQLNFNAIFNLCLQNDVPIGKIRNLKEVFELTEARALLKHFNINNKQISVTSSIAFKID